MKGGNFKELKVWEKSRILVSSIYSATKEFPSDERFGLTNQIRRAAVSIPSNIAEGRRRGSSKEFIQFLKIARGSLAEVETQIILSGDQRYLSQEKIEVLITDIDEIGRMLNALITSLNNIP